MRLLGLIYCVSEGYKSIDLSPRTMASIYAEVGPRHEAACITDQEDGSTSIFLGLTQSSQHILLRPFGLPLRELIKERGDHSGHDVSW